MPMSSSATQQYLDFWELSPSLRLPSRQWADKAACKGSDPTLFFTDSVVAREVAKSVCADCPVCSDCLEWALAVGIKEGIWGGKSSRERKKLRRAQALDAHSKNCTPKQQKRRSKSSK